MPVRALQPLPRPHRDGHSRARRLLCGSRERPRAKPARDSGFRRGRRGGVRGTARRGVSGDGAGATTPGTFVNREVDISAWAGAVVEIKFDAITDYGPDLFVDNVTVYDPTSPPGCAGVIFPADGAVDVVGTTDLEWSPTGNTDAYYVYAGTDGGGTSTPTSIANGLSVTGTMWTPPGVLPYSTTVYWQIVPYNVYGTASGCPIWSFTTQPDPTQYIPFFDGFETGTLSPVKRDSSMCKFLT